MTPKELRETLEMRKSKIDDPDFHPRPNLIRETILWLTAGAIIAICMVYGVGYLITRF
jgi:hypothetical protein